jgi:hypothetical protein
MISIFLIRVYDVRVVATPAALMAATASITIFRKPPSEAKHAGNICPTCRI